MSLTHNFLDLFVLGVALLDLFHHYHAGTLRKLWIVVAVIGLLALFGGDFAFEWLQQKNVRRTAETRMTEILLANNAQTFVELSHSVPYSESVVATALRALVDNGNITTDDIRLGQHDDSNQHMVRLYRVNKRQITTMENLQ